jgi:hypothetical protein
MDENIAAVRPPALKRRGTVDDVVGTALCLASTGAAFVGATTLPLDGL